MSGPISRWRPSRPASPGDRRAAAIEIPRGLRVNIVSPGWVKETLEKLGMDSEGGTPAIDVARTYIEAVTGKMHGQVLRAV